MKILFIGGTGIISSGCTQTALERGWDVFLLSRGMAGAPYPGATHLKGDINNREHCRALLREHSFDAVVDFLAYTPADIDRDADLFTACAMHYVFISSASIYKAPFATYPITEEAELGNPVWQYSRDKIACEERLQQVVSESKFPGTIVRPSHTYSEFYVPLPGGYTVLDRMLKGLPVIVHGDGTSVWSLTHSRDFAVGLLGLLGKPETIGQAYHITTDEQLTWNEIYRLFADRLEVKAEFIHLPSTVISRYHREWGESLLGDKAYSVQFDNAKIKKMVPEFGAKVPFKQGAREIVAWFQAHPQRQIVDPMWNDVMNRMVSDWKVFSDPLSNMT